MLTKWGVIETTNQAHWTAEDAVHSHTHTGAAARKTFVSHRKTINEVSPSEPFRRLLGGFGCSCGCRWSAWLSSGWPCLGCWVLGGAGAGPTCHCDPGCGLDGVGPGTVSVGGQTGVEGRLGDGDPEH